MTAAPGSDLDGPGPADPGTEQAESVLWAGELKILAEHHTPDRSRSYVVAHDTSVTWGIPGSPQAAAITIGRDPDRGTSRSAPLSDGSRTPLPVPPPGVQPVNRGRPL